MHLKAQISRKCIDCRLGGKAAPARKMTRSTKAHLLENFLQVLTEFRNAVALRDLYADTALACHKGRQACQAAHMRYVVAHALRKQCSLSSGVLQVERTHLRRPLPAEPTSNKWPPGCCSMRQMRQTWCTASLLQLAVVMPKVSQAQPSTHGRMCCLYHLSLNLNLTNRVRTV